MRILVVEDEALIALTIGDVLQNAGHDVVGLARDEQSAITMASRLRPELALVDLNLARGTSGAVAARALREQLGIPSVFVSGSPRECRAAAKESGALGCLNKPFTEHELARSITALAAILAGETPGELPANLELYGSSGPVAK